MNSILIKRVIARVIPEVFYGKTTCESIRKSLKIKRVFFYAGVTQWQSATFPRFHFELSRHTKYFPVKYTFLLLASSYASLLLSFAFSVTHVFGVKKSENNALRVIPGVIPNLTGRMSAVRRYA